jgi:hypothetical protein
MWFTTGIVMHFVPFPALTEMERVAGLGAIDPASLRSTPSAAVAASKIPDATRVRLIKRSDGPVYLVRGATGVRAIHDSDLSPAGVLSERIALAIAIDHAARREIATAAATFVELADFDQWTVSNGLDSHRPLFRIALNDEAATELYVSSATGEIVRDTNSHERRWNYVGSVMHWIYPTVLRRSWAAWDSVVWTLSLFALISALSGAALGILRASLKQWHVTSPYRGWHAWHHWLGLGSTIFLLTWIFSGWLSMDHGRLFSTGRLNATESAAFGIPSSWDALSARETGIAAAPALEIEWFQFGGHTYRRARMSSDTQHLSAPGTIPANDHAFLEPLDLAPLAEKLGRNCSPAITVQHGDDYPQPSAMPGAPTYRIVCGDTWFNVDGSNGETLEKLDASRRAYRWLYQGLHTLDFPTLMPHPALRTNLIILLCAIGAAFSVTAIVIGWRRLRRPSN